MPMLSSTPDVMSLTIAGPATVAEATAIRDKLADAVRHGGSVDVVFEATEVDVTSLQLMVAAQRSLKETGGALRLAHPPAGALLRALTDGGFIHSGSQDALWTTRD